MLLAPNLSWGISFFSNGANSCAKMKCVPYWLLDELLGTPEKDSAYNTSNNLVLKAYEEASAKYKSDYAKASSVVSSRRSDSLPPVEPVTISIWDTEQ